MDDLVQEFAKTTTFKYFYSTLMRFDADLNCFVSTNKLRDRDAELLTAAWWMFQEQQAQINGLKNQLSRIGYVDNGGQLMKPPVGKIPNFDLLDQKQAEIDSLKSQLNNMESCYIQLKKEWDEAVYLKNEHRKRRCQLAKELTQKSLRLTDAEFEYKRIKGLQAKDCLQIMRLTARNEQLSNELKALRGEHE